MPTFRDDIKLGTKVPMMKTDDINDQAVTNEKLAENSITKDKLQDKTIGVEKLDNELRQAIAAATGLPENLVETIQNVDDTLKDHQRQLDDKQSQIDDKQQQITANDEDISLLQTRSTQMEETIKSIAATGGASQATAVTYNNEKSGLTAVNAQAAIDETNAKLSDLSNILHVTTNKEYAFALTDANEKLALGIKRSTGDFVFGVGVPSEIRTFVLRLFSNKVNEVYEDLGIKNDDKIEKTSDIIKVVSNKEYAFALTDAINKLLMAISKKNGFLNTNGINVQDALIKVVSNKEYAFALTDANEKLALGIKRSTGDFVFGVGVPSEIRTFVLRLFSNKVNEVYEDLGIKNDDKIEKTSDIIKVVSNKEYAFALTDAINKLLMAISKKNGFLNTNGINVQDALIKVVSNKEYAFALTDPNGKLALGIKRSTGEPYFGYDYFNQIVKRLNEILGNYATKDEIKDIEVSKDEVEKINRVLGLKEAKAYNVDDFLPYQIDFNKANIGDTYDFLANVGNAGNYKHLVLNVKPYSKIKVTATGGLSPRTYGFFDIEKRLLSMAGEFEVLQNSILIAPASAFYLVVNANITSNPEPAVIYPSDSLSVDIANTKEKIEATYEINPVCENIESYVNGLQFRKELLNHVADLKKDGDLMVHVSTFCIINDVLYATYYVNTITTAEDTSKHTARFVICPMNSINDASTYKFYDLCYTKSVAENRGIEEILINNKHITNLYDIVLLRKDDNTLYLAWTCALDGNYHRVYKTYNIKENSFSDININKFILFDTIVDFSTSDLFSVFDKYNVEHKDFSGDIGIMQKLSTRVEKGITYYYTGMYIGTFNCIIKSKDLVTWEFVSMPSFENKSQWENAVYVKNNKVYYLCRQESGSAFAFLTFYDLTSGKWHTPVYINDAQSRYDFIEYNNKLYAIHSPLDRNHLAIMEIDEENLVRSRDIQVAQIPDYFYPFMQIYNNELYISFTQSRQHIFVSKFTINPISSENVREKFYNILNL